MSSSRAAGLQLRPAGVSYLRPVSKATSFRAGFVLFPFMSTGPVRVFPALESERASVLETVPRNGRSDDVDRTRYSVGVG